LSGADLAGTNAAGTDLRRADMVETQLMGSNLTNATMKGADLTGADLTGATWSDTVCHDGVVMTRTECGLSLASSESGFSHLGPITYSFSIGRGNGDDLVYTTTPANLFANNTAPYTLSPDAIDPTGPEYSPSPDSWTALGHLLYIDPALTGFSYNVNAAAVDSVQERAADFFTRGNLNPFIDAAQVLRVVLRFVDAHPDLAGNPVVLVGESYGGTRVSTMLNLLLFSGRYDTGGSSFFHDPGLVAEIKAHFGGRGASVEPLAVESVTAQFGGQVLIHPQLSSFQGEVQGDLYWRANPSIIDDVAAASGHPGAFTRNLLWCRVQFLNESTCPVMGYLPEWNRDRYNWSKDKDWSDRMEAAASNQLTKLGKLYAIVGMDVATIPGFPSDARYDSAYKVLGIMPPGLERAQVDNPGTMWPGFAQDEPAYEAALDPPSAHGGMEKWFGTLNPWDRYFTAWSKEVYAAYALNIVAPEYLLLPINADSSRVYGDFFLENARYVRTFLSDARYDLVIYSEAIPESLRRHTGTVLGVTWKHGADTPGATSFGTFDIRYIDGSTASLYYPYYTESGYVTGFVQTGFGARPTGMRSVSTIAMAPPMRVSSPR
jgi:hypothetical protein